MATQVPVFQRDRILIGYNSIALGHIGDPVNAVQPHFPLHDALKTKYGSNRPVFTNTGINADTVAGFTAAFATRCGKYCPNIVMIDGCPNDLGILQATLDALWSKLADVTQYDNRTLPRAVIFMSTVWRGSEATGGANQAQIQTDNTLIAARTAANNGLFSSGTVFADVWSLWNTRRPTTNPSNLSSGVYTPAGDGTHPNLFGAQLYSEVLSQCLSYQ